MQPLDKRHEDRARRKADNRTERGLVGPGVSLGSVVNAFIGFATLRARLSDEDRSNLDERLKGFKEEDFLSAPSLAEAEDGNTMAGIGVINTNVVPEGGNKQVEPLQKSDIENDGRNLAGRALDEQLGDKAWGSTGSPSSADLKQNGGGDTGGSDGEKAKSSGTKSK